MANFTGTGVKGMVKKRIHELAKELSLSSGELLHHMEELAIMPGTKLGPSHSVEESVAEQIKAKVLEAKQATKTTLVVKRRKKPQFEQTEESPAAEPGGEAVAGAPDRDGLGQANFARIEVASPDSPPGLVVPAEPPTEGPGTEQQPKPRPVKVPAGKYDKATIIGTHELSKSPDSRGKATPGAPDKNELPDFMKLSPTQTTGPSPRWRLGRGPGRRPSRNRRLNPRRRGPSRALTHTASAG